MYIKKGDNVIVLSGKDKGKKGKVVKALPAVSRVVVEGVAMVKKHKRATRSDQKGQIIEVSMSIHASNVALLDPKSGKATRIGKKLVGEKFVRIAKKSNQTI